MKAGDRRALLALILACASLAAVGAEKAAQQPQQADGAVDGAARPPEAAPRATAPRTTTIAPQPLRPAPLPAQAPPATTQQQPKRAQPRAQKPAPQPAGQGAVRQFTQPVQQTSPRAIPQAPATQTAEPGQPRAAARAAAAGYAVNARVFLATVPGKAGSDVGTAELAQEEKSLCTYIPYTHYKLARSASRTLQADDALTIDIDRNYSVSVKPLSDTGGRVTARIVWRTPHGRTWAKTLSFTRGVQSMVGGPNVDGGIYVLSLMIR